MKAWMILLTSLLLLGCAGVQAPALNGQAAFDDALFAPLQPTPDAQAALALTPAMQRFLAERVAPQVWRKGPQQALLEALATPGDLLLEYDSAYTRTAGEAFAARRGNCLSLVLMTAALARELGLSVRFQEVLGTPLIEHQGGFTFVVGHVNLALGAPLERARSAFDSALVVDFLPGQDLRRQQWRLIDEHRVLAMFMNNRAAEELAQGDAPAAYAWLRGAFAQDPGYAPLFNTLGVLYRRQGTFGQAERALRTALALDPQDMHVVANLDVLQRLQVARDHHRQAVAAAAGGDLAQAQAQLTQALAASSGTGEQSRYAAKLAWLKSLGATRAH